MSYFYDHMTFQKQKWWVYLLLPSTQEIADSLEYTNVIFKTHTTVALYLDAADGQDPNDDNGYRVVTMKHQIDHNGRIFVSNDWNIRQQVPNPDGSIPAKNTPLSTDAARYATQYDFDKYCFQNPDSRYPFDWNAEVYKAFISPKRVMRIISSN